MSINILKLKIKLKSLAAESRIIRKEELKNKGKWSYQADEMRAHRINHLRPITRATHVAYGLLKGLPYHEIEPVSKSYPDWTKVLKMIENYAEFNDKDSKIKELKDLIYNLKSYELAA